MVPDALAAPAIWVSRAGSSAEPRDFRGQPLGCEIRLHDAHRPARLGQHAGIGELVLIECVRQRHQNGGPADGGKLGHGGSAGARDDEMSGGHARRQVGKERRALGGDAEARIGRAHDVDVLGAHLLHDAQTRAHALRQALDGRRHDLGHDMRALAAAEHQKTQSLVRRRRAVGRCRCRDHGGRTGLPVKLILPCSFASSRASARKPVAIVLTRDASSRLARPMTPFCSCSTVGT